MSLINQMLKDLEQRGAEVKDAEQLIPTNLNTIQNPVMASLNLPHQYHAKHSIPYLKISGLIILLAGGSYLWMQNAPAISQSIKYLKTHSHLNKSPETLSDANLLSKSATQSQVVANAQTLNLKPVIMFENNQKYSPNAAAIQKKKFDIFTEKKFDVDHGQSTVMANVAPDEQLAKNVAKSNQQRKPIDLEKSTEFSDAQGLQTTSDKNTLASKSSAPSNANKNGIAKQISPEQKSANAYRQALASLQHGRVTEALNSLNQALESNPANQEARQTLAGLLIDNNRNDDARAILASGLAISPEQIDFRIALARLQMELGDQSVALDTLEQGLAYANDNADFQSFLATLLQRANRHDEAISHYNAALSINSNAANSLIGLGISLQATGKLENAQDVYKHAQSIESLSPDLSQFIVQQLKIINLQLKNPTAK